MKRTVEKLVIGFSWLSMTMLLFTVLSIIGYLFLRGCSSLDTQLIFGDTGILDALLLRKQVFNGLFPAAAGTLVLVVMSVVWAIPCLLYTSDAADE